MSHAKRIIESVLSDGCSDLEVKPWIKLGSPRVFGHRPGITLHVEFAGTPAVSQTL